MGPKRNRKQPTTPDPCIQLRIRHLEAKKNELFSRFSLWAHRTDTGNKELDRLELEEKEKAKDDPNYKESENLEECRFLELRELLYPVSDIGFPTITEQNLEACEKALKGLEETLMEGRDRMILQEKITEAIEANTYEKWVETAVYADSVGLADELREMNLFGGLDA
ncbi:hypothetical protein BJ508DRAFT_338028 [Ascobolus immersus RN42]|uniref:Uncharacterized protein n=1 Tax=Ascobolus immersus RN42 TaxID=1160509 RepID=A0A3N4HR14_ASCIM|nr:hypothetical protein BJ508DRAFT_338028 [Ascobolus immersus RN42]